SLHDALPIFISGSIVVLFSGTTSRPTNRFSVMRRSPCVASESRVRVWPDPWCGAILRSFTIGGAQMSTFLTDTEAMITTWHGISAPNGTGLRLAAELSDTIAAFEKLRGTLVFEDEPASFEAALQATKETAA